MTHQELSNPSDGGIQMATDKDFVDYVVEQIGLGSRLSYRKMFGEYALYLDAKVVAFVCDNSCSSNPPRRRSPSRRSCPKARPTPAPRTIR